jgi:hypothetical protein
MPYAIVMHCVAHLSASEMGSAVCYVNSQVAEWEAGPTCVAVVLAGTSLHVAGVFGRGAERSGTRGSDEIVGVFWECGQVNEEWNDE